MSNLDHNVYFMEKKMSQLKAYFSIAEAVSLLFYPHVEVVVHDLKTNQIAAIYNNFSKRKVGEESLLENVDGDYPDVFPPYLKTNWDGRSIKSISATLRDGKGKPVGLFCLNVDLTKWEELHSFLGNWLAAANGKPEALFKDDWREKINIYVTDYLAKNGLTLDRLNKEKKKSLVLALQREGAFKAKNSINYAADVLDLSRATIYNYLKVLP